MVIRLDIKIWKIDRGGTKKVEAEKSVWMGEKE
jgi:hypothetical protein